MKILWKKLWKNILIVLAAAGAFLWILWPLPKKPAKIPGLKKRKRERIKHRTELDAKLQANQAKQAKIKAQTSSKSLDEIKKFLEE